MQVFPASWGRTLGGGAEHWPDPAVLATDIRTVVGDGTPRLVNTPAAAAGRERIKGMFPAQIEFGEHVTDLRGRRADGKVLVNLVGRIKGTDPSAGVIGIVAHSDSAVNAPGASDDGAGVVAVAHMARALVASPPRHDVVVLITDGEEAGLIGAQVFMANHPWAADLQAVVNLDARGASGPAYVFELGPNTDELIGLMKQHLGSPRTTGLAAWIYDHMPNSTDFTVFKRTGMTGYNIAFIGDHPAYHTPLDTVERQNPETLQHMVHTGLALVRALDQMGPWQSTLMKEGLQADSTEEQRVAAVTAAKTAGGGGAGGANAANPARAAWTDILGVWILSWPETWSAAIAMLASASVMLPALWMAARGKAPGKAIARTIAGTLVIAIVGIGLGAAAAFGSHWAGLNTHSAPWRTIGLHALVWIAALVMVLAMAAFCGRRSAAAPVFAGVWLVWAVIACVGGFLLPAAGPLMVVPIACAAAGTLLGKLQSTRAAVISGSLAGLAGALVAWMPLEPAFYDALGLVIAPVTAVRAILVLLPIAPLVVLAIGDDVARPRTVPS